MDGRRRSSPQNRYLPSIFSGRRGNSRASKTSNAGTVSEPSSPGAASSVDSAKKSQRKVKQVFHYYFTRKSRRKSSGSPSQCSVVSTVVSPASQAPALVGVGAEGKDLAVQKAASPTCRLPTTVNGATVIQEDTTGKSMGDPPSPASLVEHEQIKPLSSSNPFVSQKSSSQLESRVVQQKDAVDGERLETASSLGCRDLKPTVGFASVLNADQTDKSDTRSVHAKSRNEHPLLREASTEKEDSLRAASDDDSDDPFKILASGRNRGLDQTSGKSDLSSVMGYEDDVPGTMHQIGADAVNSTVFNETNDFVSAQRFHSAEVYEGQHDLFNVSRPFGSQMEARDFVQSYSERFLEDGNRRTPVALLEEGSKTDTVTWSESTGSRPITVCMTREDGRCHRGFAHMEGTAASAPDDFPPAPPPSPSDEMLFVADSTKEFSSPIRDPHGVEDEEMLRPSQTFSQGPSMFPSLGLEHEVMFMPYEEQRGEGRFPEVDFLVDTTMAVSTHAVPERRGACARTPPDAPTTSFGSRSQSQDHSRSKQVFSSLHRHLSPPTAKDRASPGKASVACATPLGDGNDFFSLPLHVGRLPKPLTPKPPPPPPSPERTANQDVFLAADLPQQPTKPTLRRRHLAEDATCSDNTPPVPPDRQPASERASRDMGIQADTMGSAEVAAPSVSTQTVATADSWMDNALKKLEEMELRRASSAESVPQEEKWTIPLWALIAFITLLNAVAHYYGMRLRCGRPYCN